MIIRYPCTMFVDKNLHFYLLVAVFVFSCGKISDKHADSKNEELHNQYCNDVEHNDILQLFIDAKNGKIADRKTDIDKLKTPFNTQKKIKLDIKSIATKIQNLKIEDDEADVSNDDLTELECQLGLGEFEKLKRYLLNEILQKICYNIGLEYSEKGCNDYYDDNGIGKFTKWFAENEYVLSDLKEYVSSDDDGDGSYELYSDYDSNCPIKEKEFGKRIKQFYNNGESLQDDYIINKNRLIELKRKIQTLNTIKNDYLNFANNKKEGSEKFADYRQEASKLEQKKSDKIDYPDGEEYDGGICGCFHFGRKKQHKIAVQRIIEGHNRNQAQIKLQIENKKTQIETETNNIEILKKSISELEGKFQNKKKEVMETLNIALDNLDNTSNSLEIKINGDISDRLLNEIVKTINENKYYIVSKASIDNVSAKKISSGEEEKYDTTLALDKLECEDKSLSNFGYSDKNKNSISKFYCFKIKNGNDIYPIFINKNIPQSNINLVFNMKLSVVNGKFNSLKLYKDESYLLKINDEYYETIEDAFKKETFDKTIIDVEYIAIKDIDDWELCFHEGKIKFYSKVRNRYAFSLDLKNALVSIKQCINKFKSNGLPQYCDIINGNPNQVLHYRPSIIFNSRVLLKFDKFNKEKNKISETDCDFCEEKLLNSYIKAIGEFQNDFNEIKTYIDKCNEKCILDLYRNIKLYHESSLKMLKELNEIKYQRDAHKMVKIDEKHNDLDTDDWEVRYSNNRLLFYSPTKNMFKEYLPKSICTKYNLFKKVQKIIIGEEKNENTGNKSNNKGIIFLKSNTFSFIKKYCLETSESRTNLLELAPSLVNKDSYIIRIHFAPKYESELIRFDENNSQMKHNVLSALCKDEQKKSQLLHLKLLKEYDSFLGNMEVEFESFINVSNRVLDMFLINNFMNGICFKKQLIQQELKNKQNEYSIQDIDKAIKLSNLGVINKKFKDRKTTPGSLYNEVIQKVKSVLAWLKEGKISSVSSKNLTDNKKYTEIQINEDMNLDLSKISKDKFLTIKKQIKRLLGLIYHPDREESIKFDDNNIKNHIKYKEIVYELDLIGEYINCRVSK